MDGLQEIEEHISYLISEGRIGEACTLLQEAKTAGVWSETLERWAELFYPGKTRVVPGTRTGRSRKLEQQWLREHAHEYPNCWLALADDKLVAFGEDLAEVIKTIEASPHKGKCLFVKISPSGILIVLNK